MLQVECVRHDTGVNWYEEMDPEHAASHLVLVAYGKCIYRCEHDKIILEKGDILLINEGTLFYGKSIPTLTHEKYVVRFANSATLPYLPMLHTRRFVSWKPGKFDLMLHRVKSMFSQWTEKEEYYEVMCTAMLMEVLVHLNREINLGPVHAQNNHHVELMKTYIRNHYREKVTKESLSSVIGKSPNYTAFLFKKVTGQTISEYLHGIRLQTAVYLLLHSALTITDISEYLGYSDPSYFHKVFKGVTGKIPSDFLKDREEPLK
jgi:AraC family transcriptional regulator of arabinose operon